MAVITAEAAGAPAKSAPRASIALPRLGRGVAPATVGLLGTIVLAAGLSAVALVDHQGGRVVAMVAVAVGGFLVGRAGVAPPPDDADITRRDELLRARERALMDRESSVDGALVALALRRDDRAAREPEPEEVGAEPFAPVADAGSPREPRSRRPGLRTIPGTLDDDGISPFLGEPGP
jgi:hypothetical protein